MDLWKKWLAFSMKAAAVFLMALLFVFYFTVFVPVAVLFRIFSDPLRLKPGAGSFFLARVRVTETRETAIRPF